ncbi:MAG: hypothetical protein QXW91_06800 [Candidatus Nitrosotenuis sp.]
MQKEIYDYMKNHLEFLMRQMEAYLPFIRNAFPGTSIPDACFNILVGNAFYVFLGQYAMRMSTPTEQDLEEFGSLAGQYKNKIDKLFAK